MAMHPRSLCIKEESITVEPKFNHGSDKREPLSYNLRGRILGHHQFEGDPSSTDSSMTILKFLHAPLLACSHGSIDLLRLKKVLSSAPTIRNKKKRETMTITTHAMANDAALLNPLRPSAAARKKRMREASEPAGIG